MSTFVFIICSPGITKFLYDHIDHNTSLALKSVNQQLRHFFHACFRRHVHASCEYIIHDPFNEPIYLNMCPNCGSWRLQRKIQKQQIHLLTFAETLEEDDHTFGMFITTENKLLWFRLSNQRLRCVITSQYSYHRQYLSYTFRPVPLNSVFS